MARPQGPVSEEQQLFSAAARLNVAIAALGAGLGLGMLLFLATHVSIGVSERPGHYLNLLGIFMPGYSASSAGAWFGLLWGLIYGSVSGGAIAWFYVRSLGAKLPRLVIWDETAARGLRPPVLRNLKPCFGGGTWGGRSRPARPRDAVFSSCAALQTRVSMPSCYPTISRVMTLVSPVV